MDAALARGVDRRRFSTLCAAFGIAGTALPGILRAAVEAGRPLDVAALQAAEKVAGLEFTDAERELMLAGMEELRSDYERLREVSLDNSIAPALFFDPDPAAAPPPAQAKQRRVSVASELVRPSGDDELAFLGLRELGELIRRRELSSEELTTLYLQRIRRFGPRLECVVNLTEERALRQARQADREIARGAWRGLLHGVPWGAKDLLAVAGYPTTWGAKPFADQVIDLDAAVVERLDAAGAVLVAKLSLGALAWGDVWFGGTTRNPWRIEQGSSGSSAGPAAATAAGLMGFAIGSETWGSIVSPSARCGVSGLRPTFGRVSRHGAMALSWSMDKLGPMCRSVEDCALVFEAIHGADPRDPTAVSHPFVWDAEADPRSLRVGFVRSLFEDDPAAGLTGEEADAAREQRSFDLAALEVLRDLGVQLTPIELPQLPVAALSFILSAEAGAAFDELTRSGRDDELVRQIDQAWPNVFRQSRLIPAVEYIQANRVRSVAMQEMRRILAGIDVYVAPSFGGDNLLLTNLTGHPAVVVPAGFRPDGTPTSISFTGQLFGEAATLCLAGAYQRATGFHRRHPVLEELSR